MNAAQKYVVSRALTLKVISADTLAMSTSFSRSVSSIGFEGVPVLLCFSEPTTLEEAFRGLQEEYEVERAEFDEVVKNLIAANVLIPYGKEGQSAQFGFASLGGHYAMLRDTYRVLAYKSAIAEACRDKVVAEIGCGTGILSTFAALSGAKKVYAIEEAQIADVAESVFRDNGVIDRVVLLRGNSLDVELPERADVIIHELIGHDPIGENILQLIDDARERFLAEGGRLLPRDLELSCVVYAAPEDWVERDTAAVQVEELSNIYGVDLGSFAQAIRTSTRGFRCPFSGKVANSSILTAEQQLYRFDLHQPLKAQATRTTTALTCIREGQAGGVLVFFRAGFSARTMITNAPSAPATHWDYLWRPFVTPERCDPGDRVVLTAEIREELKQSSLVISLERFERAD